MILTKKKLIVIIIIALALIGLGWYLLQSRQLDKVMNQIQPEPTPRTAPKAQEVEPEIIYPLNEKPK